MSPGGELGGAILVGAASAAILSGAGAALVAWAGPIDAPGARRVHRRPTATSGGLAVIAGTSLGFAALAAADPRLGSGAAQAAATLGLAGAVGLIGAIDDLVDLGARTKLVAQAVFALVFAGVAVHVEAIPIAPGIVLQLGAALGVLGTALWIVVAANAVNFMDGADGLAAGSLAIVLLALGVAAAARQAFAMAGLAICASAALAGFLPWNLPLRRLFQGDAGSLFCGFLAAGLAIAAAAPDRGVSLYLVPFALTPFLTDVLLTLSLRARRGASLLEAHRDHLYQLWLQRTGRSHAALSLRAWALTLAYGLAGLACEAAPQGLRLALFAIGVLVCGSGWLLVRRRLEGAAVRPTG